MGRLRSGRIMGLAATFIGTVIGAGFASGQEIWVFFGRHGRCGFAGLLLAGILFALAGTRALRLGASMGEGQTYYQVLTRICGGLAPLLDLVLLFFLVVLGGVMLAGAGAVSPLLGCPPWLGIALTALAGLAIIAAGLPGLIALNKIVVPVLVAAIAAVALLAPRDGAAVPAAIQAGSWLPSSLLYASYNTVLSLPVLAALGAAEKDPGVLKAGGWLGATGLTAIGAGVLLALTRASAGAAEVPMAAAAGRIARPLAPLYALVLWAELFTTMVADVYGAAVRLRQVRGRSILFWAASAMGVGGVVSAAGFASLIKTIYPAFGLLCLVVLAGLLKPGRLPAPGS